MLTSVGASPEGSQLIREMDSKDPVVGLRATAALRRLVDQMERLHVDRARDRGLLWQEIAAALGVSKQTVHEKHARRRRLEDKE